MDEENKKLQEKINEAIRLNDALNEILPLDNYSNVEFWLWVAKNQRLISMLEFQLIKWYYDIEHI